MPDIDTSPAALRALADKLREWDRCYPGNCNVDMLASYAEDALSALAAEKEAATVKPDLTVGATDRPERLWLSAPDADGDHGVWFDGGEGGTEYVRADIADDLRASLAAAEKERDAARWQPIETAPKDGTLVDLWAGERIADCAWNVPSNCWAERSVSSFSGRPYWAVVNNPTHWMPLPAAPTNPEDAPHA